jgi:hypothetical protein
VDAGAEETLGAAVVRAWVEPGPPPQLKIRVTTKQDVRQGEVTVGVSTDVEGACDLLRGWLERLLADASSPRPEPLTRRHGP